MAESIWFSFIVALTTVLGAAIVLVNYKWAKQHSAGLTALAAGILVSIGLVEILPEAAEGGHDMGLWVAGGFLLVYLVENLFSHPHCAEDELPHQHLSSVFFLAIFFHNIIDGVTLSSGFQVSEKFGSLISIGVVVHKIPEGLAVAALLLHFGFARAKILIMTGILALAVTASTAIANFFLTGQNYPDLVYKLLSIVGGTFIYIGVADLLTHSHQHKDGKIVALFLTGFSVFLANHLFFH